MITAVLKQLPSILKFYILKHRPGYGVIMLNTWSTHAFNLNLTFTNILWELQGESEINHELNINKANKPGLCGIFPGLLVSPTFLSRNFEYSCISSSQLKAFFSNTGLGGSSSAMLGSVFLNPVQYIDILYQVRWYSSWYYPTQCTCLLL